MLADMLSLPNDERYPSLDMTSEQRRQRTFEALRLQSHRDWAQATAVRMKLQQQWHDLFCECDVVLCPPMPTPAFPHDHSTPISGREIEIDGKEYSYFDQLVWPGIATTPGLPATAAPIEISETGLPIGVQIVGPFLGDRTPIVFAELIEREFGGFVPPPGYA